MAAKQVLDKEIKYFEANKKKWLTHNKNQFSLIKNEKLVGMYTTFDEAFDAGVSLYGNQAFLIKQVVEKEPEAQFPALTVGLLYAHS